MTQSNRISFRKEPEPTGLSAIGSPRPSTDIKLNGKVIGSIVAPSRFGQDQHKWRVGVMADKAETEDDPCPWAWIFFSGRFDTEPEAREWFKAVAWPVIATRYTFRARMDEPE